MPHRSLIHDYLQAAIIAVLFALFVRTYLVQAFQIPSPSMEKTLLVGDHILVNKFIYGPTLSLAERTLLPVSPIPIRRGDIIVFKFPDQPEKDYVKRVIGLPGESLKIENRQVLIRKQGETTYSGLPETYVQHIEPDSAPDPDSLNNREPVDVPEGKYFVMGDNRDDSRDSRDWGFVPQEMIRGKALLVYWSVSSSPPPQQSASPPGPLKALRQVVSTTLTRTRWNRTFHTIH